MKKLSFVKLVPLVSESHVSSLVVLASVISNLDSDMALDSTLASSSPSFSVIIADSIADFSSNSSKVLTTKVSRLESKMVALEDKFDEVKVFSSGLDKGFLGAGVAIIINTSLACHVCKVSKVSGWLLSVKLLFKNKLSVPILGLYAGAFLAQRQSMNPYLVVLGGDFNENGFQRCASFKKYLDFGLVNSLGESSFVKMPTWINSWGMVKIINFLFVSSNLVNAVVDYVGSDIENFKNATLANAGMFFNKFTVAVKFSNLDAIKKWFKDFDSVFTKVSSKFHKLELLVLKIVKASREGNVVSFVSLIKCWDSLNSIKASIVQDLINSGVTSSHIYFVFSNMRKSYCVSKLAKSLATKEVNIRAAINKRIESFETDKGHTIKSVLECPFHKVVLDYLVSDSVKSKMDVIMEDWTKKHDMSYQYWLLGYVFDEVFSGVMCSIEFNELFDVISDLLDGKTAGLLVKRQKSICGYRLSSHFISKTGHAESQTGLSFFLAASAFINDMIWVGNSQAATQHILNIASEFFWINNISINNNKTVAILINSRVNAPFLSISGLLISIAKKGKSYQYLGIFLSTKDLSKPSLVKVNLDICFFTNLVLKKAVSDKQFLYLVLAVLYSIVSYRTQFSFVPISMIHVLLNCNLSLGGSLANLFWCCGRVPMSAVLDLCGPVSEWFKLSVAFLNGRSLFSIHSSVLNSVGSLNILESSDFVNVCDHFLQVGTNSLSVYTDGSLSNLDTVGCRAGTTTFFKNISLGLNISVLGLMSSTLAELQAIALVLESVPLLSSVKLFSDSQFALNACKSELGIACPDFCNQYWIKCCHIVNIIHSKNLKISWHKIKDHSGVSENKHADAITGDTSLSNWHLLPHLSAYFIMADDSVVSGNFRHFKVGFGSKFLADSLLSEIDWLHLSLVWHSNLYMAVSFTNRLLANVCTYFMKALYHWLPVAI
ncbi:hypothetical protein G9A89_019059 [Geosiphon pyriformis]|nr:hypothetical protein G9A89_019059 [Geosiphon pyriformis]